MNFAGCLKLSPLKPISLWLLCLVLWTQFACTKQGCAFDKEHSPELAGFRLGMSRDSIQSRFSGLKIRDSKSLDGVAEINLYGSNTVTKDQDIQATNDFSAEVNISRFPEFAGVQSVRLRFKAGHIVLLIVTYPDASKWKTEDDFVKYVAQTYHLPERKEWKDDDLKQYMGKGASVTCNGVTVRAGFQLIIGTAPGGGPAPITFPLVVVEDRDAQQSSQAGAANSQR